MATSNTAVKITPAMRRQCSQLARGTEWCGWFRYPSFSICQFGRSSYSKPKWDFACRMEDAGLIRWEPGALPFSPSTTGHIAVLTDAGKEAAK